MEIRIYVGNLAQATTKEEITSLFEQAGKVNAVDLIKDRESGLSKGFAFVAMSDQAEADKAISTYNGYSLGGNTIKVNVAKPRM